MQAELVVARKTFVHSAITFMERESQHRSDVQQAPERYNVHSLCLNRAF